MADGSAGGGGASGSATNCSANWNFASPNWVRLWGEGAYERETIDGGETKYSTLWAAREGDIIVNKIWARNGSVAVVGPELDGCVGSNEFPMYEVKPDRMIARWFHWLTKTKGFWTQCDDKSRGTSGQNRIRPERFLEIVLPLPPLAEQRRLVERIDALAAKIEEAKRLQTEADKKRNQLTHQAAAGIFQDDSWPHAALSDLLIEDSRNGIGTRPNNEPPGVPILRISAGTSRPDAVVEESDHKYLTITNKQLEQYRLKKDDPSGMPI